MQIPRLILSLMALAFLSACASTGVIPRGQDTYFLSKQGTVLSSGSSVKAALFKEAHAWCVARGLEMIVLSERSEDGVPGGNFANAEITFRAIKPAKDDPTIYDELAEKYQAAGEIDLANLARKRAAEIRAAAKR